MGSYRCRNSSASAPPCATAESSFVSSVGSGRLAPPSRFVSSKAAWHHDLDAPLVIISTRFVIQPRSDEQTYTRLDREGRLQGQDCVWIVDVLARDKKFAEEFNRPDKQSFLEWNTIHSSSSEIESVLLAMPVTKGELKKALIDGIIAPKLVKGRYGYHGFLLRQEERDTWYCADSLAVIAAFQAGFPHPLAGHVEGYTCAICRFLVPKTHITQPGYIFHHDFGPSSIYATRQSFVETPKPSRNEYDWKAPVAVVIGTATVSIPATAVAPQTARWHDYNGVLSLPPEVGPYEAIGSSAGAADTVANNAIRLEEPGHSLSGPQISCTSPGEANSEILERYRITQALTDEARVGGVYVVSAICETTLDFVEYHMKYEEDVTEIEIATRKWRKKRSGNPSKEDLRRLLPPGIDVESERAKWKRTSAVSLTTVKYNHRGETENFSFDLPDVRCTPTTLIVDQKETILYEGEPIVSHFARGAMSELESVKLPLLQSGERPSQFLHELTDGEVSCSSTIVFLGAVTIKDGKEIDPPTLALSEKDFTSSEHASGENQGQICSDVSRS